MPRFSIDEYNAVVMRREMPRAVTANGSQRAFIAEPLPHIAKSTKKQLSEAEAQNVINFFTRNGLPPCVAEFQFCETRKFRFDFAFVDYKTAVEMNGQIWKKGGHNTGTGLLRDYEKNNLAATLGWQTLFCTPAQIYTLEFIEIIKAVLKNR